MPDVAKHVVDCHDYLSMLSCFLCFFESIFFSFHFQFVSFLFDALMLSLHVIDFVVKLEHLRLLVVDILSHFFALTFNFSSSLFCLAFKF